MKTLSTTIRTLLASLVLVSVSGIESYGTIHTAMPTDQKQVNPDKGVGPFTNVTLDPIDKAKVKAGLSLLPNLS